MKTNLSLEEMKENMYTRLSSKKRRILIIWLHTDGFLKPNGKKFIKDVVDKGMYNQGQEKEILNKLRDRWILAHKKDKSEYISIDLTL